MNSLLAAVGVTIAVGGGLALVVTRFLFTHATTDPTGIGAPAFTSAVWPLRVLLGMLVPAYLINAIASRPSHSTAPTTVSAR